MGRFLTISCPIPNQIGSNWVLDGEGDEDDQVDEVERFCDYLAYQF